MYFILYLIVINSMSYLIMWIDKIKSIYQWWRISEKSLWILALLGGVFGIWLGMLAPIYHKAGKKNFRLGIPVIAVVWICIGTILILSY